MNPFRLTPSQTSRLRRLRHRAWAAVALCLLVRVGDAAIHASGPADLPNHLFSSEKSS